MRTQSKFKLIWNRNQRSGDQLVTIRIALPDGTYKYVSTDVTIPESQWDAGSQQVVNNLYAARLNKQISDRVNKIRDAEIKLNDDGRLLTSQDVDEALSMKRQNTANFIEFSLGELSKRELAGAVRYLHKRALNNLKDIGVTKFTDLTYSNIAKFDRQLKKTLKAQTSVYKQHAVIKTYIHAAVKHGLFDGTKSPYVAFDCPKGKSKIRTRLDDTEIDNLRNAELTDPQELICRDAFLFQVLTGLSYKDLCSITDANIRTNKDGMWIEGLRKKNGEYYTVFLIPEAIEIWKRYGGKKFPALPDYTQNRTLKVVAAAAKINKKLTCHCGRHSGASWMLRRGIPVAVIQQILGHSDIETTMIYARMERQTIKDEMAKLIG